MPGVVVLFERRTTSPVSRWDANHRQQQDRDGRRLDDPRQLATDCLPQSTRSSHHLHRHENSSLASTRARLGKRGCAGVSFFIPGSNKDVTQVELYLSSNGSANTPRTYLLALDARLNSFGNPVVATAQVPVTLTGKTSQALPTAFRFSLPIDSKSSDKIAFTFRVLGNPDGAGVFYNTGPCGLGACKPPRVQRDTGFRHHAASTRQHSPAERGHPVLGQ
jgi:hypothetical protein